VNQHFNPHTQKNVGRLRVVRIVGGKRLPGRTKKHEYRFLCERGKFGGFHRFIDGRLNALYLHKKVVVW